MPERIFDDRFPGSSQTEPWIGRANRPMYHPNPRSSRVLSGPSTSMESILSAKSLLNSIFLSCARVCVRVCSRARTIVRYLFTRRSILVKITGTRLPRVVSFSLFLVKKWDSTNAVLNIVEIPGQCRGWGSRNPEQIEATGTFLF